jgi:hypothetical protein
MKELCDTYDINKNSFTFDGKAYSFIKDKTNKRLADKGL